MKVAFGTTEPDTEPPTARGFDRSPTRRIFSGTVGTMDKIYAQQDPDARVGSTRHKPFSREEFYWWLLLEMSRIRRAWQAPVGGTVTEEDKEKAINEQESLDRQILFYTRPGDQFGVRGRITHCVWVNRFRDSPSAAGAEHPASNQDFWQDVAELKLRKDDFFTYLKVGQCTSLSTLICGRIMLMYNVQEAEMSGVWSMSTKAIRKASNHRITSGIPLSSMFKSKNACEEAIRNVYKKFLKRWSEAIVSGSTNGEGLTHDLELVLKGCNREELETRLRNLSSNTAQPTEDDRFKVDLFSDVDGQTEAIDRTINQDFSTATGLVCTTGVLTPKYLNQLHHYKMEWFKNLIRKQHAEEAQRARDGVQAALPLELKNINHDLFRTMGYKPKTNWV